MADQDRPNAGSPPGQRGPGQPGQHRPDEDEQQQHAGRAQPGQGQAPPKRTPRGAAGRTEAASRGGRRSAEVQQRDQYGQFAGRAGGPKKRDRDDTGETGAPRPDQSDAQETPPGGA